MTNNDILRRIRYIFDFDDDKMIDLFRLGKHTVTRAIVSDWLKKENDPTFQELSDNKLAIFLTGLIIDKRGKREGPAPIPEKVLTNNIILRKLKIALNLKTDDILEIFASIDKAISPHELNAFLRNPKQNQYRPCNDQYLRNFLNGLQLAHRDNT